jgi:hypothetical protein
MGNLDHKAGLYVVAFTLIACARGKCQTAPSDFVTADFQNVLFVPTSPGEFAAAIPGASFFSGNVSPAGRITTPTDGVRFLEVSSLGFPLAPIRSRGQLDCSEGEDYRFWAIGHFGESYVQNPGLAFTGWGPAADSDGDGRDNLMEYALGSNPKKAERELGITGALTGQPGTNQITIRIRRPAADSLLDYLPSVSGDLVHWYSDNSHLESLVIANQQGFEWIQWRDLTLATPGNPRFFRLQVQDRHSSPPVVSLTEPRPSSYFVVGDPLHIAANAFDLESCVQTVEFYGNGLLLGSGADAQIESDWTRNHASPLSLTARAVDAMGNISTTPPITVFPNYRPVIDSVGFTSVGNFHSGREISAAVAASDPDGNPLAYQLWWGTTPVTAKESFRVLRWQPSLQDSGSQTLTIRVTDSRGAVAEADHQLYVFRAPPGP